MYSTILLTHRIAVTVFLLHYTVKLILLVIDKPGLLERYTKATKIAEMIISATFLLTGAYMIINTGVIGKLLLLKLACVFIAIPLAVAGFKKKNAILGFLAVFLIVLAYGFAEMNKKSKMEGAVDTSSAKGDPLASGLTVYRHSCISCHGADGKQGTNGAKDLSATELTPDQQREIIKNGKSAMPGYNLLTDEQISDVVKYIATLKQ